MSTLVVQNLSLGVGGLPNGSVTTDDLADSAVTTAKIAAGAVVTVDLADAAVTAEKLSGAQSGSAPVYGARAWVNFNGSGTVAIRASGNVSSITDNGAGDYTVNFSTSMSDASYSFALSGSRASPNANGVMPYISEAAAPTAAALRFVISSTSSTGLDSAQCSVTIFR